MLYGVGQQVGQDSLRTVAVVDIKVHDGYATQLDTTCMAGQQETVSSKNKSMSTAQEG